MTIFQERRNRLRNLMSQMSVDAYLITNRFNIYYLSGYTGDDGVVLVTEQSAYIITDSRFEEQIKTENPDIDAIITRDYLGEALNVVAKENCVALAFESTLDYESFDYLDENASSDVVALTKVIEKMRAVKDEDEISTIRKACQLSRKGYEHILTKVHAGVTEKEMALELDYYLRKNGAAEASFETIFASGDRTALPHATYSNKKIAEGELVTCDFGYYFNHYTSDITRTFVVGKASDEMRKIYDIVRVAKEKTIEAIKAGISSKELDEIGRGYIKEKGYGEYFTHGMGHGIGLDIHELPNISYSYPDVLEAGEIVTIEPGIYIPGLGGVRIEDDILVTEKGYENLTDFKQDLIEISN